MIQTDIRKLVAYGVRTGLVPEEDITFTANRLLELFGLDEPGEPGEKAEESEARAAGCLNAQDGGAARLAGELEEILNRMCDYGCENGLIVEDSVVYRDLFDTKIMSMLMPRPSEVIRKFRELYETESPRAATDYYYKLSQDSDYIRRYRIAKDMGCAHQVRRFGHHHQSVQAGEGPQGHRRRPEREAVRLSQVPALPGE